MVVRMLFPSQISSPWLLRRGSPVRKGGKERRFLLSFVSVSICSLKMCAILGSDTVCLAHTHTTRGSHGHTTDVDPRLLSSRHDRSYKIACMKVVVCFPSRQVQTRKPIPIRLGALVLPSSFAGDHKHLPWYRTNTCHFADTERIQSVRLR